MLENLGIYSPAEASHVKTYTDQGIDFINTIKASLSSGAKEHRLLTITSSPDWNSIIEGANGDDSALDRAAALKAAITKNEADFNAKSTAYSAALTSAMSTSIQTQSPIPDDVKDKLDSMNVDLLFLITTIQSGLSELHTGAGTAGDLKATAAQLYADQDTLNGSLETSALNMKSFYYHYIVIFIVTVTVLAFTFNVLVNPNADALSAIIVVGTLLVIYLLARWLDIEI